MGTVSGSQDDRRDIQALLSRIWAAVGHRRMAGHGDFCGLQNVFTKLPFVVIKPLMAEMGMSQGEEPAASGAACLTPSSKTRSPACRLASDLCALRPAREPGMTVVVAFGIVALICGVLRAVTIYLVQTISRFFAYRVIADLRGELARHFLHLPLRFFGKRRMGDMISKVTNDTQVMQRSFEMAADNVIVDPLMILGNAVAILWFVPEAIFVLLAMLPLMAVPMYRQGKKVQQRSTKSLQAMGETTESLSQILVDQDGQGVPVEGAHLRELESTTSALTARRVQRRRAHRDVVHGHQAATAGPRARAFRPRRGRDRVR